jgi:hypothetical protein
VKFLNAKSQRLCSGLAAVRLDPIVDDTRLFWGAIRARAANAKPGK